MGNIRNIFNLSPDSNKLNKNDGLKKVHSGKYQDKTASAEKKEVSKDKAQISSAARGLLTLKTEAANYLSEIENTQTITDKDIERLKDKIESKYFLDADVIDTIVDKLIAMPNYLSKSSKSSVDE